MSLPNTIQLLAAIAGATAPGGGGGGAGASLPDYNAFGGYDVFLQSSGFAPEGSPFDAWAATQVILFADGTGVYRMSNNFYGDTDYNFTWLNSGSNTDYFVRVVQTGGAALTASSALDTNLALTSQRGWMLYVEEFDNNSSSSKFADLTVSIRDSSNNVIDSVDVYMSVIAQNGILE